MVVNCPKETSGTRLVTEMVQTSGLIEANGSFANCYALRPISDLQQGENLKVSHFISYGDCTF